MPASRTAERPKVTVTSWDYIKDNYDPEDRLAVVIKNQEKDQVIQRIDTAKAIASPDFQKWLRYQNAHGGDVFLTANALRQESTGRTRQDLAVRFRRGRLQTRYQRERDGGAGADRGNRLRSPTCTATSGPVKREDPNLDSSGAPGRSYLH